MVSLKTRERDAEKNEHFYKTQVCINYFTSTRMVRPNKLVFVFGNFFSGHAYICVVRPGAFPYHTIWVQYWKGERSSLFWWSISEEEKFANKILHHHWRKKMRCGVFPEWKKFKHIFNLQVMIGVVVENYSRFRLTDPRTSGNLDCGENREINAAQPVDPGTFQVSVL